MRKQQIVGPRVGLNLQFLNKLSRSASDKNRWKILKNASCDEILTLVEICYNILKGGFCLREQQKVKLLPHVSVVRRLSRARSEVGARKIVQKGGSCEFLKSLLNPVIRAV